jgi:DNA-directed RNA polymerase specialized sigma24 family protein
MIVSERGVCLDETEFAAFFADVEPRLHSVLVARFGLQSGREATADALSWAWEHRDRLASLRNPAGYLYRIASRRAAKPARQHPVLPEFVDRDAPDFEPRLGWALSQLSDRQRVALVLVHGWHWTVADAARSLDLTESSLRTHLSRGLNKLRSLLEVGHV